MGLSGLMLDMLGAEDNAFILVSQSGHIIAQTAGGRRLLQQPALRPVHEVLSQRAARAIDFVLDTGGETALDEEIDGQLYRLVTRPTKEGALLYFYPADARAPSLPLSLFSKITGSLSHILAMLHLLPGSSDERQDLMLQDIRRSTLRIYRGLSHLQLLERTEDPELIVNLREHDLAALCRRLIDELREKCTERGIMVNIETEIPAHCRATFDEDLMTRAVLNLLINALHAPGVSRVCLRVQHMHNQMIITVSDDGSGLSPEKLSYFYHGWERAQDADARLAQQAAGTASGLGLPLVRRIAGWHGGTLLMENGDDGGTTFHLTFAHDLHAADGSLKQTVFADTLDAAETELTAL